MNRKHTAEHFLRLIERIRAARPDLHLSGDFIVGFPGETDQDFQDTLDITREAGFGTAYSFKYSPRPGTPAAEKTAKMVDPDVANQRLYTLQAQISDQQKTLQDSMVGQTVQVMFEKPGRLEGQMVGKSQYLHAVHAIAEDVKPGDIRDVLITKSTTNSLGGELV
jgi:tRNA-2-methylthio-N6-dimethylallyladenosine synthase